MATFFDSAEKASWNMLTSQSLKLPCAAQIKTAWDQILQSSPSNSAIIDVQDWCAARIFIAREGSLIQPLLRQDESFGVRTRVL